MTSENGQKLSNGNKASGEVDVLPLVHFLSEEVISELSPRGSKILEKWIEVRTRLLNGKIDSDGFDKLTEIIFDGHDWSSKNNLVNETIKEITTEIRPPDKFEIG